MNARAQSKQHDQRPVNAAGRLAAAHAERLRLLIKVASGGKGKMLDRLLALVGMPNLRYKLGGQAFFDGPEIDAVLTALGVGKGFLDATEDMFGNPVREGEPLVHVFFVKGDEDAGYALRQALRESSLKAPDLEELLLRLTPDGVANHHDAEEILHGAKPLGYLALQEVLAALTEEGIDVSLHKLLGLPRPISAAALKSPASMAATAALKGRHGKREPLAPLAADGVDADKGETVAPLIDLLPTVEEALALPMTVAEADSAASAEAADVVDVLDVGTTTVTLDVPAAEPAAEVLPEPAAAKEDTATLLVNAMAAEAAQERDKALADAQTELVTLRQQLDDKQGQLQATATARDQALALADEMTRSLSASQRQVVEQGETLARVQAEAEAREHKLAELARKVEAAVEAREEAMARATGFEGELHAMSTQVSDLRRERAADAKALRKAEADAERSQTALDALRKAQAAVPARPKPVVKALVATTQPAAPKERRWAYAYPGGVPFRVKRAMKRQG